MAKAAKKKGRKKRKPHGGKVVAEVAEAYGIRVDTRPEDRALSPIEAGRVLGVASEAVKQWIYKRRLPAIKLSNGHWRIAVTDLESFIKKQQQVTKRKILLAGGNLGTLENRAKELEDAGNDVLIAQGLADALLKALDHYPVLYVIDLTNWNEGWALAERIRSSRNIRNSHILFLTKGNLKDSEIGRALDLRIQGCLNCDIKAKVLKQEVEKLLNQPK
jgi:excisionase family DNA binding protein